MARSKFSIPVPSKYHVCHYPRHTHLIGLIVCHWAVIEFSFCAFLALSFRADQNAVLATVFSLNSSRARLDAIRAGLSSIVKTHPEKKLIKQALGLLKTSSPLLKQRNTYAHSLFQGTDKGQLYLHDYTVAAGGQKARRHVALSHLQSLAEELFVLESDVGGLCMALKAAQTSSRSQAPKAATKASRT